VETKLEDKVAHFHIPFIGGIEVELDHVALDLQALFSEVPNSPNGFSNHLFKICEKNGLCKFLFQYKLIQLIQNWVLLEQLQNFKAASYFSSTKEVQILNKI
jgi:hypothetical protein